MALVYATASDVQARLPGRPVFSPTTKPSLDQVEGWLTEAEAMVCGTLASVSIPLPDAASGGGVIVRSWVCDYAEARVRMAQAASSGLGTNDDGKEMLKEFREQLTAIRRFPAEYDAMLRGSTSTAAQLKASNLDPAADDYQDAEFTRDMEL